MNIIEQVRDGTFDFVLTKPINSQFYASLRSIVVWRVFDIIAGLALISYSLYRLHITPTAMQIAIFVLMVVFAAVIVNPAAEILLNARSVTELVAI